MNPEVVVMLLAVFLIGSQTRNGWTAVIVSALGLLMLVFAMSARAEEPAPSVQRALEWYEEHETPEVFGAARPWTDNRSNRDEQSRPSKDNRAGQEFPYHIRVDRPYCFTPNCSRSQGLPSENTDAH